MDTSFQYQEMCEKAEEIQKYFWAEWVDAIYPEIDEHLYMLAKNRNRYGGYELNYFSSPMTKPGKNIWLPTQSQLQEMVKENHNFDLLQKFYWWCEDIADTEDWDKISKTLEQLWLAFVMKEKFDKTWNGVDWID